MDSAGISATHLRRWVRLTTQSELDGDAHYMEHSFNLSFRAEASHPHRALYLSLRSFTGEALASARIHRSAIGHPVEIICVARAYRDPFQLFRADLQCLANYLHTPLDPAAVYPFAQIERALSEADRLSPRIAAAAVAAGYMPLRLATFDPYVPTGAMRLHAGRNGSFSNLLLEVILDGGDRVTFKPIHPGSQAYAIPDFTIRDHGLRAPGVQRQAVQLAPATASA